MGKNKNEINLLYGSLTGGLLATGAAVFAFLNTAADQQRRVNAYSKALGGQVNASGASKAFLLPLSIVILVLLGLIAFLWIRARKEADQHAAMTPNVEVLDELFTTNKHLVTFQIGPGTMSHAVVVSGALERGFKLTSQGEDGSLVFQRIDSA